jgi:predicted enzyme related to lactoylglutathione lyase
MPTIVHFDIAADEPQRAKQFYQSLFGWKMFAPPGITDYYMVGTENPDGTDGLGGGLGKRGEPSQRITMYVGVDSIDDYSRKVTKLGGKVLHARMPVPGWGYLTTCVDTEGNTFGLWQEDKSAR